MAELEEFHSEDYIQFLQKINPGIIDQYKDQLSTCFDLRWIGDGLDAM